MKPIYLPFKLIKKIRKQPIKLYKSNFSISQALIGKQIHIYNGKKFILFKFKDHMIGHKIGTYILTKQIGFKIHKK